jgi:hypothetical protein
MSIELSAEAAYRLSVFSRVLAATVGAYLLANIVTAALTFLLPMATSMAYLVGVQSSFLVCSIAILWVFSARTARKAWLGLLVIGLPLALVDAYFALQGVAV